MSEDFRKEHYWKLVEEFVEELKTATYWFKPDGKPNKEWVLFEAETLDKAKNAASDAAWDAANDAAWDAARGAASAAAWDVARAVTWEAAWDATSDAQKKKLIEMIKAGIETGDVK